MAMEAWLMDESDEDQRLPHHRNPKEFVPLSKLEGIVQVLTSTTQMGKGKVVVLLHKTSQNQDHTKMTLHKLHLYKMQLTIL
ncbi:Acireductone dioxygenase (Fe(2+)-requiring) protein [Dioscorea alata]|uniref:Acireductone dioxygenase (Fe(2+)-requiring) protein n=1 Tax=Dioscorea alata TaxID=55571 RepID=A0ACB7WQK2_DIOAL|nr:Acireductone dioxygenase (Fe(2+)-requiring) protein [Dioscorea alata]